MTTRGKPADFRGRERLKLLLQGLSGAFGLLGHRMGSRRINRRLERQAVPLTIAESTRQTLLSEWTGLLDTENGTRAAVALSGEEEAVVARIKGLTEQNNRNNVTRTAAYWAVYEEHPELHWALLAHLVSRNGGWNMTDLQGELVPRLLGSRMRSSIFAMLEEANGLIFQDAYPQLLLYAESKQAGRPLFHLLPCFYISVFMRPVWVRFFRERDPVLLTVCLIINEQHYIEGRVVQRPHYRDRVLDSWTFRTQPLSQLNQVVFPYRMDREGQASESPSLRLAGLTLESFSDLQERIGFGKSLYALLFGIPAVLQGAVNFAAATPHTGSRADYWPELYSAAPLAPAPLLYAEKLDGLVLRAGAAPLYSPPLAAAWANQPPVEAERYDWFREPAKAAEELVMAAVPAEADMTAEAGLGLHKQELAVLAAQLAGLQPH